MTQPLKKYHVKSGDFVVINSGDYFKKVAKILSINKRKSKALVIFQEDFSKTIFIHISKLYLFNNALNGYSKIGYKIVENKKERYFKKLQFLK